MGMQPDWVTYIVPVRLFPLWVRLPPTTNVGPLIFAGVVEDALNAQLPWVSPRLLEPPQPASVRARMPAISDKDANLGKFSNFMTPPSLGASHFGKSTEGLISTRHRTVGKSTYVIRDPL